nr:MAG TPA: hypothetical protein [Bacteriophage sp.]
MTSFNWTYTPDNVYRCVVHNVIEPSARLKQVVAFHVHIS